MNTSIPGLQPLLLLSATVVFGLALLYLLRPRRRQVEVPFGGLWQRVIAKAEARAMSTRWRRFWSFLFNAIVALVLIAALGEGTLGLRGCSAPPEVVQRHTVLLLDTSASMATADALPVAALREDGDPSQSARPKAAVSRRIDVGVDAAAEVVRTALPHERFLVMTADSRVRVRSGWTDDPEVLQGALRRVDARDAAFDEEAALRAAQDALAGRSHGRVVWIGDAGRPSRGAPKDLRDRVDSVIVGPAAEPPAPSHSADPAGKRGVANIAVEQVSVRRTPADLGRGVVLVRVRNDLARPVRALITLSASGIARSRAEFAATGAVRGSSIAEIAAFSARTVTFDRVELSAGRFAATIAPASGDPLKDVARYDDVGFAVLASRRTLKVLLVSEGNLFLEAALHSDDRLQVTRIAPDAYSPDRFAAAGHVDHGVDLVVLDQSKLPPPEGTPALVFALQPPSNSATDAQPDAESAKPDAALIHDVELVNRAPDHPVMNGVSFADVHVDRARAIRLGSGDKALAADGNKPVIVAHDRGVRRITIGLDLLETDIGGRFALPVMIGNATDWLMSEENPLVSSLEAGAVWGIETPVSGRKWTWHKPGQSPVAARVAGRMITCSSALSGVHEWHSRELVIARPTRLPPTERPGEHTDMTGSWKPPPPHAQRLNLPPPRELWLSLLLAALLAMAAEWTLYLRRKTV